MFLISFSLSLSHFRRYIIMMMAIGDDDDGKNEIYGRIN